MQKKKTDNGSWEKSYAWYSKIVGFKGHYYHQNVIIPYLKKLISEENFTSLLDLGCGQGFLANTLFKQLEYYGIDISSSLIKTAQSNNKKAKFFNADVSLPLPIKKTNFDYACFLLSLQNMPYPDKAIKNAASHLKQGGKLTLILNHPCFRIPKKTSWKIDEDQQLQYRKIDSYMTPLKIPIQANPGKKEKSAILYSYHNSISTYANILFNNNLVIERLDELTSNKTSNGSKARMENKARKEIPLFLAVTAKKI